MEKSISPIAFCGTLSFKYWKLVFDVSLFLVVIGGNNSKLLVVDSPDDIVFIEPFEQCAQYVFAVVSLTSGTCSADIVIAVCGVFSVVTGGLTAPFCSAVKSVIISARMMVINFFICIFLS